MYIDSKPPELRSRSIKTRSRTLSLHPIDYYMGRSMDFEHCSFKDYYKTYEVTKMEYV